MLLRFAIISCLVCLPFCSSLFAEEEIRVELSTKAELSTMYLAKIHGERSDFDPPYLKELRQILQFDLGYSGYARIADSDPILEKALYHTDLNVSFNPSRWQKGGIQYVIKGVIEEKTLDLFVFNAKTGSLKKFEEISLTGYLSKDRRQIHQLSDAVIFALFGVEGVSDHQLLYSVQTDNYQPDKQDWKAEIWQCDIDGGAPVQITQEKNYAISPVFIPPKDLSAPERFLFVNYKNGQPKIYFSALSSKSAKPLLNLRGNQLLPAISKNRDQMAFICDAAGRADLFIQQIDDNGALVDKPKQLFSFPNATQASPTFHPNGKKLAFVSDKDGTPRIYVISSKPSNNKRPVAKLITRLNRENTCPCWSPDGKKLAYSAKTHGVRQIWIYDFALEEEKQLTTGPGNKENPVWAPDSLHLVFNSTDPESSELYLVNLNQPEAVKISSGPGRKHYPTWGRK